MTVVHGPVTINLFKKKNVGIQMSIDEGVSSMDNDIACAGNL